MLSVSVGEAAALDFDLACTQRLLQFENKREYQRLKAFKQMVKEAVNELFGGASPTDDELDGPVFSEDDIV